MPSPPGPQISSTILATLQSCDETDSYDSNKLKDLQTEMAALKLFALEQIFLLKQTVKLNCEHLLNQVEITRIHKLTTLTNRPFEKGSRQKLITKNHF